MKLVSIVLLSLCLPCVVLAGSSTTSGVSNAMNPALSVNALTVADYATDNDDPAHNGIRLQEAEMHFTSIVDPFWKANVILAVFPEDNGSSYGINVEEANIAGTSLPAGLGLKMGKFFLNFGKHARLHTHQFPFVESPLAVSTFLGAGLTEVGVEATYGLPIPWYSDLVLYGVNGDTEIFDNDNSQIALGAHWMNLWDASDNATLELGASFLHGQASMDHFGQSGHMNTYGVDLTYKWVSSSQSHGPALTLMGEYLLPTLDEDTNDPYGWYAMALYRVHHNWWLGGTYGQVQCGLGAGPDNLDSPFNGETREIKVNATFTPSEFSAIRLEAAYYEDLIDARDNIQYSVQWNFTIGSHPAHVY